MGLICDSLVQAGTCRLLGTAGVTVIIFQRISIGNGIRGTLLVLLPLPVKTSLLKLIAEGI